MPVSCQCFLPVPHSNSSLSHPWKEPGLFCRGSAAQAGGMCHYWQPGEDRELPLSWPGRRGAPSELSSAFPLLSPAPSAPYLSPLFPLDTRPYSSPWGLRLPTASLWTIHPRCPQGAPGRCSRAGLCSGTGPPQPIPAPTPLCHRAAALPCSPPPGSGHCREICFHRLKPFYFINCSTKPSNFAGALQRSSCFSLGVEAAQIWFFWPLEPCPKLSGGF